MTEESYIFWKRSGTCKPDVCGAVCCKSLIIPVDKSWCDPDTQRWLEHHGIEVERGKGRYAQLHIPIACQMLDENNRCRIYRERPKACREYPFRPSNDPGCTYTFEKVFPSR